MTNITCKNCGRGGYEQDDKIFCSNCQSVEDNCKCKKPIICPKCKEEISYLNFSENRHFSGQYSIDKDGWGIYDEDDYKGNPYETIKVEFFCPNCDKKLFDNWEEASEFLDKNFIEEKND